LEPITILFIVLALIASLAIAYFQYYYKSKRVGGVTIYLFLLRTLVLFLLLLLLINPSVNRQSFANEKPSLSVLVDNSSSTKYFNQDSLVQSILDDFKTNNQLNEKFDVNYYSFGEDFQLNDSLDFSENQTDIYNPLKSIQQVHKGNNHPVILISDGNQTVGSDYEYANIQKPVYPLVIGDTLQYEDLSIAQLNVNRYSFLNNQFPVEAILFYEGDQKANTRFTIEKNGKVVYGKQLSFDADRRTQTVQTNLKSDREGVNFYTAKIEYLANEKNRVNNRKSFSVEVIDKQSQILILSSMYHPDLGALKKSIESDQQRKVTIRIIDSNLELNDFQLVVLYQPNYQFKSVFDEIKNKNINYFLITGTQTDWNFINSQGLGIRKNSINQSEEYAPNFNEGYLIFAQKNIDFENLPPLQDKFGETAIDIPHQTLLFQNINGFDSEKALLATANENNHKKIFLLGEGIWKWRSNTFLKYNSFEQFDEFIGNLIQYASSKKVRNRLDVDINSIYNANTAIKVGAFYVDANYEFDNRAILILTVTNQETNESKSYPFSLNDNSYQVTLESLPSGRYNYTVSVEGQSIQKSGSFQVTEYSVEEQFTNANMEKLRRLADKTEGELFYGTESASLVDALLNDQKFVTVQKSVTKKEAMIDWKWILFVIVGLLTIEWFTRKYHGKI
jgi:hypothetical protein